MDLLIGIENALDKKAGDHYGGLMSFLFELVTKEKAMCYIDT
jgi:hypothetical protein